MRSKNGGLITPNNQIIGKSPQQNKGNNPLDNMDIELDRDSYELNAEYNNNINNHDPIVEKLLIKDNHVLIRLFKFEVETTSKGGIIIEDLDIYQTEGGQLKSRIKQVPYQKRGVIVKNGHVNVSNEFLEHLKPGNVVHVPSNSMQEFHLDKTKKVDVGNGYFMIHVGIIECIELA